MKALLGEIANIQMGYSFRERLGFVARGDIAVVQMKDLTGENRVDCRNLVRVNMKALREHHHLKPGDLIFRSRGQASTTAILIDDPGPAVVAAPLMRIRADRKLILPHYLHWFINQVSAQTFLASRAKGTSQRMISKHAIESLEICVPPLERQRAIVEIEALAIREQDLIKRISDRRRHFISRKLLQLTEGE